MSQKAKKRFVGVSPRCYGSVLSKSAKHPIWKLGGFL